MELGASLGFDMSEAYGKHTAEEVQKIADTTR